MAIGKCQDDTDIDQERVVIRFGDREVYPTPVDDAELAELSDYLRGDEVRIHVSLGTGDADVHGLGLRPHGRLRPHQRRLHHLTRRATRHLGAHVSRRPSGRATSRTCETERAQLGCVSLSDRVATPRAGMDTRALDDFAADHHGLVTRAAARATAASARRRWYPGRSPTGGSRCPPGVARLPGAPTTPEQAIAAAVLAEPGRRWRRTDRRPACGASRGRTTIPSRSSSPVAPAARARWRHRPPAAGPEGPHAGAAGEHPDDQRAAAAVRSRCRRSGERVRRPSATS